MKHHSDKTYMRLSIKEASLNIKKMEGGPFGACIVRDGKIIAVARNKVLVSDATSHAEINSIRIASKRLKTFDLSGCAIYSTTEPCPMCFSAIHWARINKVFYGTTIRDVKKIGFNEMSIANIKMKKLGKSKIKIKSEFLRNECLKLLKDWNKLDYKVLY